MPRWQYFFLCLWAFVCDIAPHANLQIIESQGNNSRRLFCPLTTLVVAADAVILPKAALAATQMRRRERKLRLETTLEAPVLGPEVGLDAVGDLCQSHCLLFIKFKMF